MNFLENVESYIKFKKVVKNSSNIFFYGLKTAVISIIVNTRLNTNMADPFEI